MTNFVDYSRGLMEASKGLRTHALRAPDGDVKQTLLRAALLHACSFLEAHLNYMAEHFRDSEMFSLHEQGILLQREITFKSGKFLISDNVRFSRIHDRIDLLLTKCSTNPEDRKSGWYPELTTALLHRNSVVHPKEVRQLQDSDVKLALRSILAAADTLYLVVFQKGLPYAKRGIEGGLDLGIP